MKIERVISWFDKRTEEFQGEYNIDNIELELLKQIFNPKKEDPLMYDAYTIYNQEAKKLEEITSFKFDLDRFVYEVNCFQV
ncbi:DUF7683 domain-containing protein [Hufsiella ginkgonis]|uniref:DUF7683 domain-containing protein n=1 Tax=Hufsiella ginkgonis TaxID=2695274 RepID=A0A7K1Y4C9_9SPHI|nr:hypothetical protein [Hufsiella ginkgonis]MXV17717.1 hypothetical protein [Hufsiella ginkgonis]